MNKETDLYDIQQPHSTDYESVFKLLKTSESGLTETDAKHRQEAYGKNSLPLAPPRSLFSRLLSQFHNVLIYVLICSGVVSLILQHYLDGTVIFGVVIINALIGFIQEGKAEDALRAIMSLTKSHCMVTRDGALEMIDSSDLVPGDVVMLQAGDRVPADVRLFYCKDFRCDESALTGEAQPIGKRADTVAPDTLLAERKNMAYMGTMVTYGLARGVVTHIGIKTQIGEISHLVGTVVLVQTPLQKQLALFAHQLTFGIVALSLITVILGYSIYQYPMDEIFQAAISIAVSSIPEGLPAIVTISLAIGVQRMAKKNALVRRLPAVEVLGSVDIICSDKTGTLTANEMTSREVFAATGYYRISGEGYKPVGEILHSTSSKQVLMGHDECFTQACKIAMLCNDSRVECEGRHWILHGDPTEGALLVLAMKHGLVAQELLHQWQRVDILPFDSEKRYMATLHHNQKGTIELMVKGAPERLLNYASHQLGECGLEPLNQQQWSQAVDDFAGRGMRVLALAYKQMDKRPDAMGFNEVECNLVMAGLVGISDPPRHDVIASIKTCQAAGIKVKMITGDNPITAAAIGKELGLKSDSVITGLDIDRLNESQLAEVIEHTDVFARTSPANKLQLVNALQQSNHVVAMTGDGVNDAPALKQANIGVAMGKKGTDAAKEAADFVLTDDNFSTIAEAVREGRTVYDNIVKSIIFVLPTNLAEALVIIVALMSGRMMPITPAQILWINMVTAITLALVLAFEQSERDIMSRAPRPFGQGLFSGALVARMLMVGVMGAVIVFALFFYYRASGASIEYARTITVNALVLVELFYLFNCRLLKSSIFSREFLRGTRPMVIACVAIILLQLTLSYLPSSQEVFGLASIQLQDWLIIVLSALPVLFIVELEKFIQLKFEKHQSAKKLLQA